MLSGWSTDTVGLIYQCMFVGAEAEDKPGLKNKTYFEHDMWKIGTRCVTYG